MPDLVNVTLVNRYFLRKLAGKGGMAHVYQAWDQERHTQMAVKIVYGDFIDTMITEVQALIALSHPNIVRLFDVELDKPKNILFFVMEWIDGNDLLKLQQKKGGPLGVGEIAHILDSVHKALHFAHSRGVCHCDIKPANILIRDTDNQALLSDFGLAGVMNQQAKGGTPIYMAPEQLQGGSANVRTDIYSLGVTLYQLLSGRPPFLKREEILSSPPPPLGQFNKSLSPRMIHVIEKALAKSPLQRHASVTELWQDFDQARKSATMTQVHRSTLTGLKGEATSKKIPITDKGLSIGRGPDNHLRLRDISVSRAHARIGWEQGQFCIRDLGSTVGTFVNEQAISSNKAIALKHGARIRIGKADLFEFHIIQ